MPPIKLLRGDKHFYGEIAPAGKGDADNLENPAPPPNPLSRIPLKTETQRQNNKVSFGDKGDVPDSQKSQTETDMKSYEKSNDLGRRITNFLQAPLVKVSEADQQTHKKREVARITGEEEKVENIIRPVGEIPVDISNRAINFIENKGLQLLLIVGGLYLAGQYLQGIGGRSPNKKKIMDD